MAILRHCAHELNGCGKVKQSRKLCHNFARISPRIFTALRRACTIANLHQNKIERFLGSLLYADIHYLMGHDIGTVFWVRG
jgi:hypothetical protein